MARPRRERYRPKCRYTKKTIFKDRIDALLFICTAVKDDPRDPAGQSIQRAYACTHCGGWHLTSQPLMVPLEEEGTP